MSVLRYRAGLPGAVRARRSGAVTGPEAAAGRKRQRRAALDGENGVIRCRPRKTAHSSHEVGTHPRFVL